ncbi:uncharacterized protein PAC_04837 [Phialocephala subalpina]|uniref:Uncharacterized protein n=1 Tax=Phialocephala subalpina TaxID=576137 RepID=A0A1L7WQ94_9HELO|nr:uncharacterized protein PAC_04837 [Phialocephala subalpina]
MNLHACVRILPKASYAGRTPFLTHQCRTIFLMTETFGGKKKLLVDTEILNIVPFKNFKPPEKCIIDLHYVLPAKDQRRTTLHSVMDFNINPGWLLSPKESAVSTECPQYKMKSLITNKLQSNALQRPGKGSMRSKIFKFNSKTSQHTFVELMALMWHHLNNRQVVEVQVQLNRNKANKGPGSLERMFDEKPHLRPDVMLKAMPENCGIVVDPQTDQHGSVCWVYGPPHVDKKGKISLPNNQTHKLYKRREKALGEMAASRGAFLEGLDDKKMEELLSEDRKSEDTNDLVDGPAIDTAHVDWASKMRETLGGRQALEEILKAKRERRRLRQKLEKRFQQRLSEKLPERE